MPRRTSRDFVLDLRWQIRAMRLSEPAPNEIRFHPSRRWRFDLAWPDRKLAVEVEGGSWGEKVWTKDGRELRAGGRHNRGQGFEDDCIKYSEAAIEGWRVVRVTTKMVDDGRAVALVARALDTIDRSGDDTT